MSPMQPLSRWGSRHRLAVLAYHAIDDPERFREQMSYLKRRVHPVSLGAVLGAFAGRCSLPEHAVLVTFDDGDRSVLEVAAPVLSEYGMPGVACVVAGVLDSDRPHWWDEADDLWQAGGRVEGLGVQGPTDLVRVLKRVPDGRRSAALQELRRTVGSAATPRAQLRSHELPQLEAAGIEVANHTMSHPCLPTCHPEVIRDEIRTAHEALRAILGHTPRAFAYPNGDWDDRAAGVLEELGYEIAFLFDHRMADPAAGDALRVPRLRVGSAASLDRFQIIVSGLHPAMHHRLGRP
jgi:peptidoglycan/xylan/chitin deacetylase (PgdA/CDA1 family)